MVEGERTGSGVDVLNVKKDLQLRQQDFGMMRDSLSSELALLEGALPKCQRDGGKHGGNGGIHEDMQNMRA
eukprot:4211168-Prorocentrum_lima.AAC.1